MERGESLGIVRSCLVVAACSAVLLAALVPSARGAAEEHFLDYSEDNFKAIFISGNLTAAVTHDWPRIVWWHSTAPFSPTFEVSMPKMYLYNDSNGDGVFAMSEAIYTAYLDQNHVTWNATTVEFHNDTLSGEYAQFRMNATLSLYKGLVNQTVDVSDWANITFWFRITENTTYHSNSFGTYPVRGKIDLSLNFTIDVLNRVNSSGIVLEQLLQGGGSNEMFMLKEGGSHTQPLYNAVSARVDETGLGLNHTNAFLATDLANQEIAFSKDDGTVQAHYIWDSQPRAGANESSPPVLFNNSYFTTGTGLMLHTAYQIGNSTGPLYHEATIGIDEAGFVLRITDWLKDNLVNILLVIGIVVAVVAALVMIGGRLKSRRKANESNQPEEQKGQVP